MKLFDRYLIKEFIWPFISLWCFGVFLIQIIEIFEKLDDFVADKLSFFDILRLYIYKSPAVFVEVVPAAVVFATVYSISKLTRYNETIAFLTAGITFSKLTRCILIAGLILSIAMIGLNEFLVPVSSKAAEMFSDYLLKITRDKNRYNFVKYGNDNIVYRINFYQSSLNLMHSVSIIKKTEAGGLEWQLSAAEARWDSEKRLWIFYSGKIIFFNEQDDVISIERFDRKEIRLKEEPDDFSKAEYTVNEMGIVEGWQYIQKLKQSGFDYKKELVNLHSKFSYPFACFVMGFIGISISSLFSVKKNVLFSSFAIMLLFSFIYQIIYSLFITMGQYGVIPAFISAWFTNLIFIIAGILLHRKIKT